MRLLHNKAARSILFAALSLASAASLTPHARAQARRGSPVASARQTARAFFDYHFSHDKSFTGRNVRLRRRWLTPKLYAALRAELREAAARAKSHPDEAPSIGGDPFTDSQEYPDGFRIGKAVGGGARMEVEITFKWNARAGTAANEKTALVVVDKSGARWLVANIVGANGEDLLSLLRRPRD